MLEEKVVIIADERYPLNGIFTLPDESYWPCSAVVFVHGSGSSNMDERIQKLTPFKDLAEGLAKLGVASIRYDKRSFAHGLKMVRSKEVITVQQETVDDAIKAVEVLKEDTRIKDVYIVGHSMGGMLAPRIDLAADAKGLIIMAGSARNLHEIMLGQFDDMKANSNRLTRWILDKSTKKIEDTLTKLDSMSDEEAKKTSLGNGTTAYYFKEMMNYPTDELLRNTEKPVLILQGDADFQVSVEKDYKLYQQICDGKENVSFKLYEGLNHAFVSYISKDITKAKNEYNVERHIPEYVMNDIVEWMKNTQ
ncbi:MAG: alpha/beta fold hydrolase [Erysipelotrichaceae bacterium]|nr:alpha/beta fold hydrolase [Erysipelotrichaceae bacterium]